MEAYTAKRGGGGGVRIARDVAYTQAKNCTLCLHIGSTAFYFGEGKRHNYRLELFTERRRFRWSNLMP
jgi:hypothetical protein